MLRVFLLFFEINEGYKGWFINDVSNGVDYVWNKCLIFCCIFCYEYFWYWFYFYVKYIFYWKMFDFIVFGIIGKCF